MKILQQWRIENDNTSRCWRQDLLRGGRRQTASTWSRREIPPPERFVSKLVKTNQLAFWACYHNHG